MKPQIELPQDKDAEFALAGAVIFGRPWLAEVLAEVDPADFAFPGPRAVIVASRKLLQAGRTIDAGSVMATVAPEERWRFDFTGTEGN